MSGDIIVSCLCQTLVGCELTQVLRVRMLAACISGYMVVVFCSRRETLLTEGVPRVAASSQMQVEDVGRWDELACGADKQCCRTLM